MKHLNIVIKESPVTNVMDFLGKAGSKDCSRPMICTLNCSGLTDSGVVRLNEAIKRIETLFEDEIWVEPATLVQSLINEIEREMERRGLS